MGGFLPLLGGLVGSRLGGSIVTDWLGGPSKILPGAFDVIPGMGSTTPADLLDLEQGPDFVSPTIPGKIPLTDNPKGTTLGISNEKLGPVLAGLAGSLALTPFTRQNLVGNNGEVPSLPRPPGFQQQSFGRIPLSQTGQTVGVSKHYIGKNIGQNLTVEELIRLLRSS